MIAPGVDALVDVEGSRGNFERSVFSLTSPDKLRIKMRIVGIGLREMTGGSVCGVTSPTGGLFKAQGLTSMNWNVTGLYTRRRKKATARTSSVIISNRTVRKMSAVLAPNF